MRRAHVVMLLALGVIGLMMLDQAQSAPLNPYTAAPMLALGSGLAAAGAHCAAPPPSAR